MNGMTILSQPICPPLWGLASLKINQPQLRAWLGIPHYVETDSRRTCGGEEDGWGYSLPNGQRLVVVLDVTSEWAELYGDPPELNPILLALGISPDDSRLVTHAEPWELK